MKVVKNKLAPPFKKAEFEILYGEGISRLGELIDMGVEYDMVNKAGSWYSYNDERIGQGKENARAYLLENPEMANEIDQRLRAQLLPSADDLNQDTEADEGDQAAEEEATEA